MYPYILKKSKSLIVSKLQKHYGTYWDVRHTLSSLLEGIDEMDSFAISAMEVESDELTENRYIISRIKDWLIMWISGEFKEGESLVLYSPVNLMDQMISFCNKIESIVDIEFENNIENIQDYI